MTHTVSCILLGGEKLDSYPSLSIRKHHILNQAYSEYKHSLTFRVRRYVVITTKPVHRLQLLPIVHN